MVSASPTTRQRSSGLPFDEFLVLAALALLLCAVLLPLLVVALPLALVWLTGTRRGWWPAWLPVLVGVLAGGAWALWLRAHGGWETALDGYLTVQQDALVSLISHAQSRDAVTTWALPYLGAVWPYAVPGGVVLSLPLFHFLLTLRLPRDEKHAASGAALTFHDAGRLAAAPEQAVAWLLPNVVGQGVLTLLSAPPGLGKGFWTWGLLRAMQDGGSFYGLPVRRPMRPARWLRPARPRKVLWLTEEGQSVARTARRFGIAPGLVVMLRRDQVRLSTWSDIVRAVRREAWRRGCAYIVVDTVRAWCPQAEVSNDGAAEVMNLARAEWAEPGLGVLWVHHDRKGGGDYGEGVAGAYNLVGSVDVLVQLQRVKDRPDARRMVVSRRFGDLDVTARLDGVRYVADGGAGGGHVQATAGASSAAVRPDLPVIPDHLVPTLAVISAAGPDGVTRAAVQAAAAVPVATVGRHLAALEALAVVVRAGAGRKGEPLVWRAVPPPAPTDGPPTASVDYVRYLHSAAWAAKRAAVLARADGRCEDCGAVVPAGETEVHHLTYARMGDELPEDLLALCPADHRRRHANAARPAGG